MTSSAKSTKLVFVGGFDDVAAYEAEVRGYRSHVLVEVEGGNLYPVFFYEPGRLAQDLETMAEHSEPLIAEPGMIVVSSVTLGNMVKAAEKIFRQGFFDYLRPLATVDMEKLKAGHWPPDLS